MFTKDIGIDLGTANTLVYMKGKGIVLREPSVVAVDVREDQVLAVGAQAKEMIGRTPGSIAAIRPLKDGVIADFEITAIMLKHFIRKVVHSNFFSRPRIVICIPSGVTQVEKRAVEDAARQAGGRDIELIEEPMAAAIMTYVKKKYGLTIGERTAEEVKINIGSAYPHENEKTMTIKGRNTVDGLPKDVTISAEEVRNALASPLATIIDGVIDTLEKTPPELSADIIDRGITLTGGGALLKGLDLLISRQTGMPVHIADRPLDCVADGAGKRLETVMPKDFYRDRRR